MHAPGGLGAACEACGAMFQPTREGTRTCSRECAGKIRKDAVPDLECRNCGTRFHCHRGVMFCSIACVHKYNRRTLPERMCEHCGAAFRPAKRFAKFCSVACGKSAAYYRKRNTLPERSCKECNEAFAPKKETQAFCCVGCASRHTKRQKREAKQNTGFTCEEVRSKAA